MDIFLLGNYPNDEQESMIRYAEMLRKGLAAKGWRAEILRPQPFFGRLKRSGQGLGKWLGYLDKFVLFPFVLRRRIRQQKKKGDFLVHICDHSNGMYTRWLKDVPHLVTCHDVLAIQSALGLIPGHTTRWTGRRLQNWILSSLKRARYVVCVSEETRKDLLSLAPELESRSRTIENALNYPYAPMQPEWARQHLSSLGIDSLVEGDGRFLLHVGGNQWYKNREGVIRIFGRLCASCPDLAGNLKLVMVGKPPTAAMRGLVDKENVAEKVIFLAGVSNEQLGALYSLAEALLFPSLREGFGWPILEAQACGCPVVTSDRPPMNRFGGPAAILADPENPIDFAGQLRELLTEEPPMRHLRKAEAQHHASTYDLRIFLTQIIDVYRTILPK